MSAIRRADWKVRAPFDFPPKNHEGEIFDYERVKATFAGVASQFPGKIIEHLVNAGEAWANGRGQQDDMTFVVMKAK